MDHSFAGLSAALLEYILYLTGSQATFYSYVDLCIAMLYKEPVCTINHIGVVTSLRMAILVRSLDVTTTKSCEVTEDSRARPVDTMRDIGARIGI